MRRQRDPIEELSAAIVEETQADGVAVKISHSNRDGYGIAGASVIQVEAGLSPDPILLWHEQGNDFWIEFGNGIPDAAWWSQGDDLGVLAKVISAALTGGLQVSGARVTVRVDGMKPIRLAERF